MGSGGARCVLALCLVVALAPLDGGCGGASAGAGDAGPGDSREAGAGVDGGATDAEPDQGTPDSGADGAPGPAPAYGIFQLYGDEYDAFRAAAGYSLLGYWDFVDQHVAALHVSFTRTNTLLIWGLVEPTLGAGYVWDGQTKTDAVVAATYRPAAGKQMDMLLVIEPARGGPDVPRFPTGLEAEYQAFVRAVVERYDGDGTDDADGSVRVKHWQVMNEPFFEIERGQITTAEYAALVALTAGAVQGADPEARLVLGDLGPHFGEVIGLLDPGVAVHAADTHFWDGAAYQSPALGPMRAALDAAGRNDTAIWMCEFGTWVHQPRNQPAQTETEQARWLVKAMIANRAAGASRILWNNLVGWSNFSGDPESMFNFMGLVSSGTLSGDVAADLGRERIAYWAYQRLIAETETDVADLEGGVDPGPLSLRGFWFTRRADGRVVAVVWNDAGTGGTVELLACGGPRAVAVDLVPGVDGTFQETVQDCVGGTATFDFAGPGPILVRGTD